MNLQTDYRYLSNSLFLFLVEDLYLSFSWSSSQDYWHSTLLIPAHFFSDNWCKHCDTVRFWLTDSSCEGYFIAPLYSTPSSAIAPPGTPPVRDTDHSGEGTGAAEISSRYKRYSENLRSWGNAETTSLMPYFITAPQLFLQKIMLYKIATNITQASGFIRVTWRWRTCHFQWWIALIPAHLLC